MELKNLGLSEVWSKPELPSKRLSGGSGLGAVHRAIGSRPLPFKGLGLDERQYSAMASVLYCLATSPLCETLNDQELRRRGSISEASRALPSNRPERLLYDLVRLLRSIPGSGAPVDSMELLVGIREIAREPEFRSLGLENPSAYSVFQLFMQLCHVCRVFSEQERRSVFAEDDDIFEPEVTCFTTTITFCGRCSNTEDYVSSMHSAWWYALDIPKNRHSAKLEELFRETCSSREFKVCPTCRRTAEIETIKDLLLTPKTLVLLINRQQGFTLEFRKSINILAEYGVINEPSYNLTGVIKCIGPNTYKAIVRARNEDRWYECVGKSIEERQMGERNKSDTVEMLFYEKCVR